MSRGCKNEKLDEENDNPNKFEMELICIHYT